VETAGAMKMWKTQTTGFPHFHRALENSLRKKRCASFPQVPTGPTSGFLPVKEGKNLDGEYPIDVWHDPKHQRRYCMK
jgi:hypothetical protein